MRSENHKDKDSKHAEKMKEKEEKRAEKMKEKAGEACRENEGKGRQGTPRKMIIWQGYRRTGPTAQTGSNSRCGHGGLPAQAWSGLP